MTIKNLDTHERPERQPRQPPLNWTSNNFCFRRPQTRVKMSGHDDLFELRNYFYLGNLSAATTEGETVTVAGHGLQIEKRVLQSRIELAKGNHARVLASITDGDPPALQVVRLLAQLAGDPSSAPTASAAVGVWLTDDVSANSPCFVLMCAILLASLGDHDGSLKAAARLPGSLELLAVKVQTLLRVDRADVAEREVAAMRAIDEDATLTQLAGAWTALAKGGGAAEEAVYIFQDLLERHGATEMILNGMAVCAVARGKAEEAERSLQEALVKNPNCVNTLINAIACAKYRNKPQELVKRYFEQMKRVAPENGWLRDYVAKEEEFDTLAASISA